MLCIYSVVNCSIINASPYDYIITVCINIKYKICFHHTITRFKFHESECFKLLSLLFQSCTVKILLINIRRLYIRYKPAYIQLEPDMHVLHVKMQNACISMSPHVATCVSFGTYITNLRHQLNASILFLLAISTC